MAIDAKRGLSAPPACVPEDILKQMKGAPA